MVSIRQQKEAVNQLPKRHGMSRADHKICERPARVTVQAGAVRQGKLSAYAPSILGYDFRRVEGAFLIYAPWNVLGEIVAPSSLSSSTQGGSRGE